MHEEPTTVIIQRYLDALPGDPASEPIVRELLERADRPIAHFVCHVPLQELPEADTAADESGDG